MWKRIAIIVLVLSPLGYRTVVAAISAFQKAGDGGERGAAQGWSEPPAEPALLGQGDADLMERFAQAASQGYLMAGEPWEPGGLPSGLVAKWKAVCDSAPLAVGWPEAPKLRGAGEPTSDILSRAIPLDEQKLKGLIGELDDELAVMREEGAWIDDCLAIVQSFDEGGPLLRGIQAREQKVKRLLADLTIARSNAGRLLAAMESLSREDFAAAQRELDAWEVSSLAGAPPADIVALQKRCAFLVQAQQFLEQAKVALDDNDANALAAAYNVASRLKTLFTSLDASAKDAEMWNECVAAAGRIEVRLEVLNLEPPLDLESWLAKAEKLLAADETSRIKIGETLAQGLVGQFPAHSSAFDADVQFAKRKTTGEIFQGYFEAHGDVDGHPSWYDFWKNKADWKAKVANVNKRTRLGFANLEAPPEYPPMILAAKEYNAARHRLMADPSDRESWEVMEATCEKWRRTIANFHRTYRTGANPEFDLEHEEQLAENVLQHWSQVEGLLRN